jgi:predicted glycosyltransferase
MLPQRILICPLDWGLGHATRCIPLIRELKYSGAEVVIASDGLQLALLREEFPDTEFIRLRGYNVKYSHSTGAAIKILFEIPRIAFKVLQEHIRLKKIIREYRISGVISDNRYGLWNKQVKTIFITHQLNLIAPGIFSISGLMLRWAVRFFARQFDECWIPDSASQENLSGKLSHGYKLPSNTRFIGLLSRFDLTFENGNGNVNKYDLVALVSGPEPQRTIFENKLLAQLPLRDLRCLILRGLPGKNEITNIRKNLDIADHQNSRQLHKILLKKPVVICRAGYSTLMDIAFTGNRAILIPTPGQTEQEYLAAMLDSKGYYVAQKQKDMNLEKALERLECNPVEKIASYHLLYPAAVRSFLQSAQGQLQNKA